MKKYLLCEKCKYKLKKMKKVAFMMIAMLNMLCLNAQMVYAGDTKKAGNLGDTKLVSGTSNLLGDGTLILTGLVGAVGGFFCVKAGYAWYTAEEEAKGRKKKAFWTTFAISVLITCAPSALSAVLAYYA